MATYASLFKDAANYYLAESPIIFLLLMAASCEGQRV